MKISEMDNEHLLVCFESACFNVTNYKGNKKHAERFNKLEDELAKRLGVDIAKVRANAER